MKMLEKITDYDFHDSSLYHQYNNCKSLNDYVNNKNEYIKQWLESFFYNMSKQMNLYDESTEKLYTAFVLFNYYGLKTIPNPSTAKVIVKNLYDDNSTYYDSSFIYDHLLNVVESDNIGLELDQFIAVAKYILNYSIQVTSIPGICELLKLWSSSFDSKTLDLRTLKYKTSRDGVEITLPNEEKWDQFRLIVKYSPELLGLPYGDSISFILEANSELEKENKPL